MTALGTIKTSWIAGEIVNEDDLNRIEANIEFAAKPNVAQIINTAHTNVLSNTTITAIPGVSVVHKAETGRIFITLTLIMEMVSAGSSQLEIYLHMNGANLLLPYWGKQFLVAGSLTSENRFHTIDLTFMYGGLTIDATNTYEVRFRNSGGTAISPTLRVSRLNIVDL